ncbi:hypothetical protein T190611E02C_40309 [Tenacibaculum sp. 190524A05c]|uniref:hypothetical protein n=1 Tax=Tenacibaculum platacis TaxID=3137852 RepID=UPI0031FAF4D1
MNLEEETLEKIKFMLSCNNEAQAIRAIEQYGFYKHQEAIKLFNSKKNNKMSNETQAISFKGRISIEIDMKLNVPKWVAEEIVGTKGDVLSLYRPTEYNHLTDMIDLEQCTFCDDLTDVEVFEL